MLKFLRTQAYTVLLNTLYKPKLSLLIGDGMLFTLVLLFVAVLMIYLASSSLFHVPISKDPRIFSVVEYTREA